MSFLKRPAFVGLGVTLAVVTLGGGATVARASNSDNQSVLSGTGVHTTFSQGGSVMFACDCSGYWIWSEPAGTNSYGESSGNGAGDMYIYPFGINSPVDVSSVDLSGNTLSETVELTKNNLVCTFTATETSPGHGTVSYTCPNVPVPQKFGGGTATVSSTADTTVNLSGFSR